MARFQFSAPLTTAMGLLVPSYEEALGVSKKVFPSVEDLPADKIINVSFRSFGGTERTVNDLYTVEDTATVETWYRPDIKSDCHLVLLETGEEYEILGKPEDIELRHQYMRMKVRAIEGGA